MALDYSLYTDESISREDMQAVISETVKKYSISNPFLIVPYQIPLDDFIRDSIEGAFRFKPASGISLRLDKFVPDEIAEKSTIEIVLGLIKSRKWKNLALLFQGEIPILALTDGTLYLNDARNFWSDERKAWIDTPFELKSMPVL